MLLLLLFEYCIVDLLLPLETLEDASLVAL